MFQRIKKWYHQRCQEADREMFVRTFRGYSPIKQEVELRRFIAKNFPGFHIRKTPKRNVGKGWGRKRYPAGDE